MRLFSVLSLAIFVACGGGSSSGSGSSGTPDGGSPPGLPTDPGGPLDDAGVPPPTTDAGTPDDAGAVADAGTSPDAGTPPADGGTTAFRYDVIDLGSELGDGLPQRIRDDGIIVGTAIIDGQGSFLFTYDLASKVVTRPTALEGTFVMVDGHGNGVGGTGDGHGFLQQGPTVTDVGTLAASFTVALDFNAAFQVVGTSAVPGEPLTHNFLWQDGTMTDLGQAGDNSGLPLLINASGQVAGTLHPTQVNDASEHAFLYGKGAVRDLGSLGGAGITRTEALNGLGHVAGFSSTAAGFNHVFFWDGAMHDLTPGAAPTAVTEVQGMNDADVVVGSMGPESDSRAFAILDGKIVDLNDVVAPSTFRLWHATGINNQGQIVGVGGEVGGKNPRAFLLNPR